MREPRSSSRGSVALVLHAHLPWLREKGDAVTLEERWFFEALWECYLPLLGAFESLAADKLGRPLLTLSISPTLLAMLRDPSLPERFDRHTGELEARFSGAKRARPELAAAAADHEARLGASRALMSRIRGDVVGALVGLAEAGVLELATTAATHAFLPGLRSADAVRGQIRMGMRYFQTVTKRLPQTFWLPECGYDERFETILADSGIQSTVLAAHGLELARPRPPNGTDTPIVGEGPIAYFGRSNALVDRVWSRERGYPSHVDYREFYAAADEERALKPWRITGRDEKAPYDPAVAQKRVSEDASDYVRAVVQTIERSPAEDPVLVLAFDAELFGHWWWEGPSFVETVVRELGKRGLARSLGGYLERDPTLPVAKPATSTWGRGGYAEVWTHPASSHAARLVHRAERRALQVDATVRDTPRSETQRLARLWAIRELFLLQASDYAFMLRTGEFAAFAQRKLFEHANAIDALCDIASRDVEAPEDRKLVDGWIARRPFFRELDEDAWSDAFDPW